MIDDLIIIIWIILYQKLKYKVYNHHMESTWKSCAIGHLLEPSKSSGNGHVKFTWKTSSTQTSSPCGFHVSMLSGFLPSPLHFRYWNHLSFFLFLFSRRDVLLVQRRISSGKIARQSLRSLWLFCEVLTLNLVDCRLARRGWMAASGASASTDSCPAHRSSVHGWTAPRYGIAYFEHRHICGLELIFTLFCRVRQFRPLLEAAVQNASQVWSDVNCCYRTLTLGYLARHPAAVGLSIEVNRRCWISCRI